MNSICTITVLASLGLGSLPAWMTSVPAVNGTTSTTSTTTLTNPSSTPIPVFIGKDTNSALNPFIQPQSSALSGGGRDQTQQFFDLLIGNVYGPGVVIGRLGADVMIGGPSVDILIRGPGHFNPDNRDKGLGLDGDDIFLWSPGDGSDRFEGGQGLDTVVFGLMGEKDANGKLVFKVSNDQLAGDVFLDPWNYGLPKMDVTNSPGFCNIIDKSSSSTAAKELAEIDSEHLAQFILRGVNQDFKNNKQNTDNGLRVTLSLKEVEFVVCASEAGGKIEAYDLRYSPPRLVPLSYVPLFVTWIVQ